MNILILSPFFPYPLDQGGKIRVFNIIKQLSRRHRVTLACVSAGPVADYGPLREYCVEIIAMERRPSIGRDLIRFLAGREPFNYVALSSGPLRAELRRVIGERAFDLVQVEFSTMWQYADLFRGVPVALDAHNIEAEIIRQVRGFYRNPLRKLLYTIEERKLRSAELRAWNECSVCFTVSGREGGMIAGRTGSTARLMTVPNGVDLERFSFAPRNDGGSRLLLLGGLRFQPNLDAARYFLGEILPLVRARRPDVTVDVVATRLDLLGDRSQYPGALFHDGVSEVMPLFRQADVLPVPLRLGAGTRIKILEAMAAGLPVVTTSKGCEGIAAVHNRHLLIADTAADFAAAIHRLLGDADLRRTLTREARKLVEERYSWESVMSGVEARYAELVRS